MTDPNFSAIRARLRYKSLDEFVEGYGRYISRGGMFVPMAAQKLKPIGTTVRFQFLLADGASAFLGEGIVRQIKGLENDSPAGPVGMLVKFTKLSQESKALVERIIGDKAHSEAMESSEPEEAPAQDEASSDEGESNTGVLKASEADSLLQEAASFDEPNTAEHLVDEETRQALGWKDEDNTAEAILPAPDPAVEEPGITRERGIEPVSDPEEDAWGLSAPDSEPEEDAWGFSAPDSEPEEESSGVDAFDSGSGAEKSEEKEEASGFDAFDLGFGNDEPGERAEPKESSLEPAEEKRFFGSPDEEEDFSSLELPQEEPAEEEVDTIFDSPHEDSWSSDEDYGDDEDLDALFGVAEEESPLELPPSREAPATAPESPAPLAPAPPKAIKETEGIKVMSFTGEDIGESAAREFEEFATAGEEDEFDALFDDIFGGGGADPFGGEGGGEEDLFGGQSKPESTSPLGEESSVALALDEEDLLQEDFSEDHEELDQVFPGVHEEDSFEGPGQEFSEDFEEEFLGLQEHSDDGFELPDKEEVPGSPAPLPSPSFGLQAPIVDDDDEFYQPPAPAPTGSSTFGLEAPIVDDEDEELGFLAPAGDQEEDRDASDKILSLLAMEEEQEGQGLSLSLSGGLNADSSEVEEEEDSLRSLMKNEKMKIESRQEGDEEVDENRDILDDLLGDDDLPPPVMPPSFDVPKPGEKKKKGFMSKLFGKE